MLRCTGSRQVALCAARSLRSLKGHSTRASAARWSLCRDASSDAPNARVTPRHADFSAWYADVISAAELAENSAVRGCPILKPNGYAIWEEVKTALDGRIKATGHVNAYFPTLLPLSFLSREAAHVDGFAKECAVVTHHRLRLAPTAHVGGVGLSAEDGLRAGETGARSKTSAAAGAVLVEPDPASKLQEPLILRPTSETIIWDAYSRWVQTHRDLPLLINQWANVFRWEMRTRPFLRTSEFLWQEGHTAHATAAEARAEVDTMLQQYEQLCTEQCAMPVVKGVKSPSERFAGADDTFTCEAMMQNGWALQAATSHFLGQSFAKAFNVMFTTAAGQREHVWATSWGASTRLIGGIIMTHSDDMGLVLPPAIAPTQVVIVPIVSSATAARTDDLLAAAARLAAMLRAAGVRVAVDTDVSTPPGGRFFKWERRGVPVRLEVGARDLAAHQVVLRQRTGGDRHVLPDDSALPTCIQRLLSSMQADMLAAATRRMDVNTVRVSSVPAFHAAIATAANRGQPTMAAGGGPAPRDYVPTSPFILAPWCDDAAEEARVKEETKFTIRCFPSAEQAAVAGERCFWSGRPATHIALFARAF